ncbi:hypothetical protein COY07_05815 [Candidatus Peregrinibacteria bacterium CG_4_10_14_0_2_um_filter_43_11]|nr:MAG: hypothetical protein COY07_05815 [Candidatus Peregrinibacteria bacterium CG_4_10_14_0_2_um_filter_43_11]
MTSKFTSAIIEERFIEGRYPPDPLRERLFEVIAERDKIRLVLDPSQGSEGHCYLTDSSSVKQSVQNNIREPYRKDRPLSGRDSYESEWDIRPGSLPLILDAYRRFAKKEELSVLDTGCGHGQPLATLFRQCPWIDQKHSAGLTLPNLREDSKKSLTPDTVDPDAAENIIFANFAHLTARPEQRFDVSLDIFGVAYYHPMNRDYGMNTDTGKSVVVEYDDCFGILQRLNCIKIGGLLWGNRTHPKNHVIKVLLKWGILTPFKEAYKYSLAPSPEDAIQPFILLRRPTLEEIQKLLGIINDFYYTDSILRPMKWEEQNQL